jgi:DNA-binding CsgD family transcriptional regulator
MHSFNSILIESHQQNLLFPGKKEYRRKINLVELAESIPGYAQINSIDTFGLLYANKKWESYFGFQSGEMVKHYTNFEKVYFCNLTREKTITEIIDFGKKNTGSKVFGYFQKIRKDENSEFINFICFTQKFENQNCFLTILFPVKVFGENAHALNILIDYNEFISNNYSKIASLTRREREILHLIGLGNTRKAIVKMLNISKHTVDNHSKHIRSKLEIKNSAELYHYIFAFNLM